MLNETRLSGLALLAGDLLAESPEVPFNEPAALSIGGFALAEAFEDMPDLTEQDMIRFVYECLPHALAEAGLPLVEAGWLTRAAHRIGRAAFGAKNALTKKRSAGDVARGAGRLALGTAKVAGRVAGGAVGGALRGAAKGAMKSLSLQKQAAVHKFVGAGLKAGAKAARAAQSAAKGAVGVARAAQAGYRQAAAGGGDAPKPKLPASKPAAPPAAKPAAAAGPKKPTAIRGVAAGPTTKAHWQRRKVSNESIADVFGEELGFELAEAFCQANEGLYVADDDVISYVLGNLPTVTTSGDLDEAGILKHIAAIAKGAIRGAKAAHAAAKAAKAVKSEPEKTTVSAPPISRERAAQVRAHHAAQAATQHSHSEPDSTKAGVKPPKHEPTSTGSHTSVDRPAPGDHRRRVPASELPTRSPSLGAHHGGDWSAAKSPGGMAGWARRASASKASNTKAAIIAARKAAGAKEWLDHLDSLLLKVG